MCENHWNSSFRDVSVRQFVASSAEDIFLTMVSPKAFFE